MRCPLIPFPTSLKELSSGVYHRQCVSRPCGSPSEGTSYTFKSVVNLLVTCTSPRVVVAVQESKTSFIFDFASDFKTWVDRSSVWTSLKPCHDSNALPGRSRTWGLMYGTDESY